MKDGRALTVLVSARLRDIDTVYIRMFIVTVAKCGGVLVATGGYLQFPDSSQYYDNQQHCMWSFGFPTLSTILIKFISFDVEAGKDFLIITDEQGTLAKFTGTSLPVYNERVSSTANITFISDGSGTRKGFVLEYQSLPGL